MECRQQAGDGASRGEQDSSREPWKRVGRKLADADPICGEKESGSDRENERENLTILITISVLVILFSSLYVA